QTIAQAIQVAQRQGNFSTIVMKKGDDEIDIVFSQYEKPEDLYREVVDEHENISTDELTQVPVRSPLLGITMPLEDLGTFTLKRGMGSVQRENRERISRLRFDTAPNSNFREIETSVRELINAYPLPAGYRMSLGGRFEQMQEEVAAFQMMVLLAVILIYMSIASLFE